MSEYAKLLRRSLIAIGICLVTVLVCFFWIGTYGFDPFERGDDLGSFPSGHAARILSFAGVWFMTVAA